MANLLLQISIGFYWWFLLTSGMKVELFLICQMRSTHWKIFSELSFCMEMGVAFLREAQKLFWLSKVWANCYFFFIFDLNICWCNFYPDKNRRNKSQEIWYLAYQSLWITTVHWACPLVAMDCPRPLAEMKVESRDYPWITMETVWITQTIRIMLIRLTLDISGLFSFFSTVSCLPAAS